MNMLIVAAASFLPFFGSAIYYNSAIELPNSFGIFDKVVTGFLLDQLLLILHTIIKPVALKMKNVMASLVCCHCIES